MTANAEYSNESSYKNTETVKTVLVSSRYLFPQGRIDFSIPGTGFDDDVVLNSVFIDTINTALSKSTVTEQREGLYNAFEEFGHVFRTKIQIGGTLSAHTMETYNRTVSNYALRT